MFDSSPGGCPLYLQNTMRGGTGQSPVHWPPRSVEERKRREKKTSRQPGVDTTDRLSHLVGHRFLKTTVRTPCTTATAWESITTACSKSPAGTPAACHSSHASAFFKEKQEKRNAQGSERGLGRKEWYVLMGGGLYRVSKDVIDHMRG
jgi:hypothetical protein